MVMVFNKTGFESWIEDLCFSLSFQNALSPHPHGGGHPQVYRSDYAGGGAQGGQDGEGGGI